MKSHKLQLHLEINRPGFVIKPIVLFELNYNPLQRIKLLWKRSQKYMIQLYTSHMLPLTK